jgi:enoyl-[acyl-carrier-protein] reductase (NADH)
MDGTLGTFKLPRINDMKDEKIGTISYKLEVKNQEEIMELITEVKKTLLKIDSLLGDIDAKFEDQKGSDNE